MKAVKGEGGKYELESPTDRTRLVLDPDTGDYDAVAPDPDDLPETPEPDPVEPEPDTVDAPAIVIAEPVHTDTDEGTSWITWKK